MMITNYVTVSTAFNPTPNTQIASPTPKTATHISSPLKSPHPLRKLLPKYPDPPLQLPPKYPHPRLTLPPKYPHPPPKTTTQISSPSALKLTTNGLDQQSVSQSVYPEKIKLRAAPAKQIPN